MPGPAVRIDVSNHARDFRIVTIQPGLTILHRWGSQSSLVQSWLGRFAAEPEWEGESVAFFVSDGQGGRLTEATCQPASPQDLRGSLRKELAAVRECLDQVNPQTGSARAVHAYLTQIVHDDPQRQQQHWFKHRAPEGTWQLVLCVGYAPNSERLLARPVICGTPECRQLTRINPRQTVTCDRCDSWVPPRRSCRLVRWVAMAALLLLIAAAIGGGWLVSRPVISGRAIRAVDGQPLAGAAVRIAGTEFELTTEPSGRFQGQLPWPQRVVLNVAAPGYEKQQLDLAFIFGRQEPREIVLEGAGRLEGRVRCRVGSQYEPVAGAQVRILDWNHNPIQSDAEGRFELRALPPGMHQLEISCPGYATGIVETPRELSAATWEVVLTGERVLEGRVVHAADLDLPIVGAEVRLADSETAGVQTDESGRFRIPDLPPLPVRIQALAPGFAPQRLLIPPDAPPPTMPLAGDATLSGVVVRRKTEQPVADAAVIFLDLPFETRTNDQGQFRLVEVPSGSAKLQATAGAISATLSALLAANQETTLRIELDEEVVPPTLVDIQGRVVRAVDDQPIAEVTVAISTPRIVDRSDHDGQFQLKAVPEGSRLLGALAPGYQPWIEELRVEPDLEPRQISLVGSAQLQGQIVDTLDQQPIQNATVALKSLPWQTTSNDQGHFVLEQIVAGTVELQVTAPDYQPEQVSWELESGTHDLGVLELTPLATEPEEPEESEEPEEPEAGVESVASYELAQEAEDAGELSVDFFGIRSPARAAAFVVDRSGSMWGTRMERAKSELLQAVLRLRSEQRFYIVFFCSRDEPMSGPPRELVPATVGEKIRAAQWIGSIEAQGGTRPESGLQMVAQMDPDVIYLLSDGEFQPLSSPTMELLKSKQIVVNTIALEDKSGARLLREIAEQTGGSYRFISASEILLELETAYFEWLVGRLNSASPTELETLREALKQLSGGHDFGPEPGDAPAERAAAIDQWRQAWVTREAGFEERQLQIKAEETRRRQREWDADERLRLATELRERYEERDQLGDPETRKRLHRRLQEIIREFPDSEAADEAQRLISGEN